MASHDCDTYLDQIIKFNMDLVKLICRIYLVRITNFLIKYPEANLGGTCHSHYLTTKQLRRY